MPRRTLRRISVLDNVQFEPFFLEQTPRRVSRPVLVLGNAQSKYILCRTWFETNRLGTRPRRHWTFRLLDNVQVWTLLLWFDTKAHFATNFGFGQRPILLLFLHELCKHTETRFATNVSCRQCATWPFDYVRFCARCTLNLSYWKRRQEDLM